MSTAMVRTERPTLDGVRPTLASFGRAHPEILRLRVFGSVARGDAKPSSDVDVAVEFSPGSVPRGLAGFAFLDELETRLSMALDRAVNLVMQGSPKSGHPPSVHPLQRAILRDGRVVYETEPAAN